MEHLSDASFLGKLLVFPPNVRLDWKVIASYKHSSLLRKSVNYAGKKFHNIGPRMTTLVFFIVYVVNIFVDSIELFYTVRCQADVNELFLSVTDATDQGILKGEASLYR